MEPRVSTESGTVVTPILIDQLVYQVNELLKEAVKKEHVISTVLMIEILEKIDALCPVEILKGLLHLGDANIEIILPFSFASMVLADVDIAEIKKVVQGKRALSLTYPATLDEVNNISLQNSTVLNDDLMYKKKVSKLLFDEELCGSLDQHSSEDQSIESHLAIARGEENYASNQEKSLIQDDMNINIRSIKETMLVSSIKEQIKEQLHRFRNMYEKHLRRFENLLTSLGYDDQKFEFFNKEDLWSIDDLICGVNCSTYFPRVVSFVLTMCCFSFEFTISVLKGNIEVSSLVSAKHEGCCIQILNLKNNIDSATQEHFTETMIDDLDNLSNLSLISDYDGGCSSISDWNFAERKTLQKSSHCRWHLVRYFLAEQAEIREKNIRAVTKSVKRSHWERKCSDQVCSLLCSGDASEESCTENRMTGKEKQHLKKSRQLYKNRSLKSSHGSIMGLPQIVILSQTRCFGDPFCTLCNQGNIQTLPDSIVPFHIASPSLPLPMDSETPSLKTNQLDLASLKPQENAVAFHDSCQVLGTDDILKIIVPIPLQFLPEKYCSNFRIVVKYGSALASSEVVGIGDMLKPYREKVVTGPCCPQHVVTRHVREKRECNWFQNGVGSNPNKILYIDKTDNKLSRSIEKSTYQYKGKHSANVPVPSPSHSHSGLDKSAYIFDHPASQSRLILNATPLLHAHDFVKIIQLLSPRLSNMSNEEKPPACFLLGLAHLKLKSYSEAIHYFVMCQNLCVPMETFNGKADKALCSIYSGDCQFTLQHYHEAAKHYSEGSHSYSTSNVAILFRMIPPSISAIHAKCGSAFRHAQKPVEAVAHFKLAITLAKTDKDRLSANTSLGNLYQSLGENSSAVPCYEESIRLSEKLLDNVSLGWAHGNLGNAYLGLFQKDKALFHLQKSLELTVEYEPTPQAIGRTYNNLGTAYQSLGDLDKAQEYYDLALTQAVYGNDTAGQARVYGNIGNVFMLRKNYKEAIPHYTEVLRLSKDRSTLSTAHHNRGCAYYEWAEAKMDALSAYEGHQCYFHGPGFEADSRPVVIQEIASYYQQGSEDLQEVVRYHEENLDNIKGSSESLNLSISLFETNSRTFHRLQDCLVSLGKYTQALLVAEQSRARTLGELMLKRKGWSLPLPLSSPLQFEQVIATVANRSHPVLYLSYTGARLLGWVFIPQDGDVQMNMFEVPLKDDQFDGKSFDYHLRYSLQETLVEKSHEMYSEVKYDELSCKPLKYLYDLIAEPLIKVLERYTNFAEVHKVTVVSDSYTALLPFLSLYNAERGFLGDTMRFQVMPSLLCMSVMEQLPDCNVVRIPADTHSMCIAGNPTIPQFKYNDDIWNLGKLPFAKLEAQWVAHIVKATPILEEQATKSAILLRIQSAKVIHLATHGSASAGFLAFGAMVSVGQDVAVAAESVLLHPEDVEQLNISPALVVLSSCDSGRGAMKADGIQGMARAFILAGAQAVLTTLWRVPDESASIFMQFFYQFMMDGLESTRALQKAILSIRCFLKYSQFIHWSGYQLTGRDVLFECSIPNTTRVLKHQLGTSITFPRLRVVKDLESALVNDPCFPTDLQILQGCPGVKSSEIAIDFIYGSHQHFRGGVFWINCQSQKFISAAIDNIEKVLQTNLEELEVTELKPVLLVLDGLTTLPGTENRDDSSKLLLKLMACRHAHCIVLYQHYQPPDSLVRAVDQKLLRGCMIRTIDPLTIIQSTQRTVYTLQREVDLAPNNSDQEILEKQAEFTAGSPVLVDIISQLMLTWLKKDSSSCSDPHKENKLSSKLKELSESIKLDMKRQAREVKDREFLMRDISTTFKEKIPSVSELSEEQRDEWDTRCVYDSWESINDIISSFHLLHEEKTLLNCLSIFGCCPIPVSLVTTLSSRICDSSGKPYLTSTLLRSLASKSFILTYPSPVVFYPSVDPSSVGEEFVYLPQYVASYLWKSLEDYDRTFALATNYHALSSLSSSNHPFYAKYLLGLVELLEDAMHMHSDLMGDECCMETYRLCFKLFQIPSGCPTPTSFRPSSSA